MADHQPSNITIDWLAGLGTIITILVGIITKTTHRLIQKGKEIANNENRIKMMENNISDLKISLVKEIELREEIKDSMKEISDKISYLNGKIDELEKS